jgi:glycosyltransferase involved in cell wall biosynthesis
MSETIITIVPSLSNGGTERVGILLSKEFKQKGFKSYLFYYNNIVSNSNNALFDELDLVFSDSNLLWNILSNQHIKFVHIHNNYFNIPLDFRNKLRSFSVIIYEQSVWSFPDDVRYDFSFQLSKYALLKFQNSPNCLIPAKIIPYCYSFEAVKYLRTNSVKKVFGRIGSQSMAKWSLKYIDIIFSTLEGIKNSEWILVGCPDLLKEKILNRLDKSLADRIYFYSEIDSRLELNEVYNRITDFIHISNIGESFGLVLLEAINNGCRVHTLASPWTDNTQTELIGNSKRGKVFANSSSMINYLLKSYDDSDFENDIVLVNNYLAQFSPVEIAEKVLNVETIKSQNVKLELIIKEQKMVISGKSNLLNLYFSIQKYFYINNSFIDKLFGYVWRRTF